MKHLFYPLIVLMMALGAVDARAQAPEQDCINAIPVCQNFYSQPNAYQGTGSFPAELTSINQGCLGTGERNDVWYVINVSSSGTLAFTIQSNVLSDDYDFGVWDVTGVGCNAIFNYSTNTANAYPPVGCNFAGSVANGQTGLSNVNTGVAWSPALNVVAGQTLVLNVSNYSLTQNGYTLDFSPSTASIFDNVPPKFLNVTTQCQFASSTLNVKMSEPVKCASIAPNASDFYITPATGTVIASANGLSCGSTANSATNNIQLNLSGTLAPGTYWLHANTGSDNNTLLDNCGNMQLTSDSVQFVLVNADPPKMVFVDTPACTKARIHFDRGIKCSTVAPDGSDFTVTGPGAVAIKQAIPIGCSSKGLSDTVDLYFTTAVFTPGTYTIALKTGTDNDVLTDTCGLIANNTISFTVSDQGYVYTTATPDVLCAPGYVQLGATVTIGAPPVTLNCGVNGTPACGTPTDYAVGDPAAVGVAANTPFSGAFSDGRTQLLYKASELLSAGLKSGTISKLAFNVTAKQSTLPYDNLTIKMSCTSDTGLTTFKPGLPIVYSPKSYSTVLGANTFTLDNTYDWDGTSNIIVEVCYDNTGSSTSDILQTTVGLFNGAALHNQVNGASGCALPDPSPVPAGIRRANITFSQCPPPAGVHQYLWSPSQYVSDTSAPNTVAYVPQTMSYQLQIQDTNSCYRRAASTVTISVRNPVLSSHDTALCIGYSAQLHAGGGVTYNWFPATGLSDPTSPDPVATPTQTTTYSVSIADQYGCADTLSETVTVNPLPVVDAGRDTSIIFGNQLQLYANAPGGKFYLWNPPTWLNNPIAPNPLASPQISTTYTVFVTDTNQCRSQDSIRINVIRDVPVFIPSGFAPGGDGNNTIFRVANLTFQRVQEFRVLNRWGQEVFSAKDNHGWDGTFNGVLQDMGVYNYLIRIASPDGRVQTFRGDVTLIR